MTPSALADFVANLPDEGSFSLWTGPLDGAAWFVSNDEAPHYAASTMKLFLVIAAYTAAESGRLDLDQPVTIRNDFRSSSGSGRFAIDAAEDEDPEPWRRLGQSVVLRWLCHRALVRSSNLAANLIFEAVGPEAIAAALDTSGVNGSRVERGIEDAAARAAGLDNVVTSGDLARTLQGLATARLASRASCTEIMAILGAQQLNDAIPRGLPVDVGVAHKSGWVDGCSHDAAVISPPDSKPFVFVMCTTSGLSPSAALDLIARGARAAWSDRSVRCGPHPMVRS